MTISAADAAFEGFRLARRAPIAIALWSVLFFLSSLVSGAVLVGLAGPAAGEFLAVSPAEMARAEPEAMQALMAEVAPAMLVLFAWNVVLNAVFLSAVARAVLRPEAAAFGYLRLGPVEIVQVGNLLLWSAAVLLAFFVAAMVSGVLAAVLGAVAGAAAAGILTLAMLVASLVLAAWATARLSMAGPAVVDTGRIGIVASWRLSAGRTRALVGATLLATSLALAVIVLMGLVFAPLTALLGADGGPPDTSSLAALFTPAWLVSTAGGAIASALAGAILGGYGARAYVLLRPAPPAT